MESVINNYHDNSTLLVKLEENKSFSWRYNSEPRVAYNYVITENNFAQIGKTERVLAAYNKLKENNLDRSNMKLSTLIYVTHKVENYETFMQVFKNLTINQ